MSTKAEDEVVDLADHEFERPCISKGCPNAARWAGWSTHGYRECPAGGFVCDEHKDFLVNWWARILQEGVDCARCHTGLLGQVSDNLKFIPL